MTTTTPWAHLPNAKHIDAVLADVNTRPEVWKAARDAARDAAWAAAWDAAWAAVRAAARAAAWVAAGDAARYTLNAVGATARHAAQDIIRALIAWDSSADLLDLPADTLRTMIDLAPEPVCHQAALLLPWTIVREAT